MNPFRAFRIHELDGRIVGRFDNLTLDDLGPGEVVVRVEYSTSTTRTRWPRPARRILRKYPLVAASTSRVSWWARAIPATPPVSTCW